MWASPHTNLCFCGRVPWLYQYWPGGFMLFVVLCPGTPEGSTGSSSGFKASQRTGQRLKVSSDRLGEAGSTNLVPTSNRRNNGDHSLIIKHHYIITKSSVPVFWNMCLVLKEVYVSGAHDIGPALRRRFVWFDSYVPSTIFQLCRDVSSWVEPVLS